MKRNIASERLATYGIIHKVWCSWFEIPGYDTVAFYIHGSVQRESSLITVQQDATYTVYYISVGSSTCFGC